MSRQTERDLYVVIQENLTYWWEDLETGKKAAVVWLGVLFGLLVLLTVIYPMVMLVIWGIITAIVCFFATMASIVTLFM